MKKQKNLKVSIIKGLERVPFGVFVLYILRILKLYFYYKPRFLINSLRANEADIFKVYWINPRSIKYCSSGKFNKRTDIGKAEGGDWDLSQREFEKLWTYLGFEERFKQNREWKDTIYYKNTLEELHSGKMPWMCRNEEELKQRFKNLDSLYSHIKKNGFSDNPEEMLDVYSYKKKLLRDANRTQGFLDYIMVDISRNGKPLFADGKHRLSIAKILNIDRVPVIVRVRHKYWAKFKNELREYSKIEVGGKLYQKAYHFDLEDIPYIYDESRIKLVKNSTSLTKGTVLDIGAYFGLHSHELERLGFECWAVESNLPRIYFMEKLREANRDSFKIIKKSIFDFKKKGEIKFDMVIAIYIFHHFLKTKSDYEKLKDFLQRLNCREMFLGTHNPKEFETKEVYTNYGPEEFSDFVLANSCLEKKELIKEYKNGRRLYKLYK